MLDAMSFVALLRPALRPVPSIFVSIARRWKKLLPGINLIRQQRG